MNRGLRIAGYGLILLLVTVTLAVPAYGYQQPLPPMVIEGVAYVEGERAENGTLVEATIEGETVASFETVTAEDQVGFFIIRIDAEEGDEIVFLVGGETAEALVEGETLATVEYEPGFHVIDLVVAAPPPTRTLTMAVEGNGQTAPAVGDHTYPEGARVRIGAVPDTGWRFDGWSGDVNDPGSVSTNVVVDTDKTVTARFVLMPTRTPSPEPTVTSTPTPGPSPTPTATPEPSPTPTITPTPTATAEVSPTPSPEASPPATEEESPTSPAETTSSAASPSPTEGEATEPTTESGALTVQPTGEDEGSPSPSAPGDVTPTPASPSESEENPNPLGGNWTLIIIAAVVGAVGIGAIVAGVLGFRQGAG